jgi:hypothetical protein
MSVIQVDVELSPHDLLHAAGQLNANELDALVYDLLALKARRYAPVLSQAEADLLQKINVGLSADRQKRYAQLIQKRRAESLTPTEHAELLRLTEEVEALNTKRVARLIELSQLRGVSLTTLLADLGLDKPDYA